MISKHYLATIAGLAIASTPLNAATTVDGGFTNNANRLQAWRPAVGTSDGDTGGSTITHFTVGADNLKITSLGIFRSNPSDGSNPNGVNFDRTNYSGLTAGSDFGFTSANPLQLRIYKADTVSTYTGANLETDTKLATSAGLITTLNFDDAFTVAGVSGVNSLGAFIYQASGIVLEANATYAIAASGWSTAATTSINTGVEDFTFGRSNVNNNGSNENTEATPNPSTDTPNSAYSSLFNIGYSTYTGNAGDKGPNSSLGDWYASDHNGGTLWTHASFTAEVTTDAATDPPTTDPDPSPIPEPSTALLFITSLAAGLFRRQRR